MDNVLIWVHAGVMIAIFICIFRSISILREETDNAASFISSRLLIIEMNIGREKLYEAAEKINHKGMLDFYSGIPEKMWKQTCETRETK